VTQNGAPVDNVGIGGTLNLLGIGNHRQRLIQSNVEKSLKRPHKWQYISDNHQYMLCHWVKHEA
jgi:hypothetical protein